MLVAKSLAVPKGMTAMASDLGASSLTSALATCAMNKVEGRPCQGPVLHACYGDMLMA